MEPPTDNPYAPPVEMGVVTPMRSDFSEIDTKALKKLCNDSHTIRAVTALLILGITLGGAIIVFLASPGAFEGNSLAMWVGITAFQCVTAVGLILRATWGRVLGFISGALMLIGFPLGTLIGLLFLVSLARATRLFGPGRFTHKALEAEWKYRRKFKVP